MARSGRCNQTVFVHVKSSNHPQPTVAKAQEDLLFFNVYLLHLTYDIYMPLTNEYYMNFILYVASHRQFCNIGSNLYNLNTITSPLSTPQSLRKLEIINEGYHPDPDQVIAESSFTESATPMG